MTSISSGLCMTDYQTTNRKKLLDVTALPKFKNSVDRIDPSLIGSIFGSKTHAAHVIFTYSDSAVSFSYINALLCELVSNTDTEFSVDYLEELGEDTGRSSSDAAKIFKASVLFELQTLKAQAAAVTPSAVAALASGVDSVDDSIWTHSFYTADPDTITIDSTIKWSPSALQVLLVLTTDCMIGVSRYSFTRSFASS
jgi:hypothetical protein